MTEHRGTKRLKGSTSVPGGLGATFPRPERDEHVSTAYFAAYQPTRSGIEGPSVEDTESVQAQPLLAQNGVYQPNTPPSRHYIQNYSTILGQCIGKSIFEVSPDGRVVASADLRNVFAEETGILLLYTTDTNDNKMFTALMPFATLRSRSGNILLFGRRYVQTMPLQWVWDWRKVKYNR